MAIYPISKLSCVYRTDRGYGPYGQLIFIRWNLFGKVLFYDETRRIYGVIPNGVDTTNVQTVVRDLMHSYDAGNYADPTMAEKTLLLQEAEAAVDGIIIQLGDIS